MTQKAFVDSKYFSGQGVLMLATKHSSTGEPQGFLPVGNVPDLTLGISVTKYEHKESQSGSRGVDFEQAQEVGLSANFTVEHFSKENLAMVGYGTASAITQGTDVTANGVYGGHNMWTALPHVKISNLVVKSADDVTTYVEDTDYVVNPDAGSFMVLDTGSIGDGDLLNCTYDHEAQDGIEGLTSSSAPIRWARFEGLNTADSDKPVIVNIFKLSIQPLAEMALIQDEIAGFTVECKGLSDGTRTSGSKYWNMRKI
jgi:hypothetical protein